MTAANGISVEALLRYVDSRVATLESFLPLDDDCAIAEEIAMLRQLASAAQSVERASPAKDGGEQQIAWRRRAIWRIKVDCSPQYGQWVYSDWPDKPGLQTLQSRLRVSTRCSLASQMRPQSAVPSIPSRVPSRYDLQMAKSVGVPPGYMKIGTSAGLSLATSLRTLLAEVERLTNHELAEVFQTRCASE